MLKFSFLIPIYNGEKYLKRLFDSLLAQDIPYEEYEIVCVDDCSKDSSVDLILRYQDKYSNIRIIKNPHNCRLATNINTLVANAYGKYIWFVGQDDYVEPNCLSRLYFQLEDGQLDVIVFNYRRVSTEEHTIMDCKVVSASNKQTGVDWVKDQFNNRDYCQYILGYEWRAIYRTEYWREKNIRCVDGMNYEDTIIMLRAIMLSSAVASEDDILYNYRINSSSITYQENFVKRGDLIYEFAFMVGQEIEDCYNELRLIDGVLAQNLHTHLIKRYNNFVFDLIRTPNEQKKAFYKLLMRNRMFVKSKRNYLNWKSRLFTNTIVGYPLACVCNLTYRTYKKLSKCRIFYSKS